MEIPRKYGSIFVPKVVMKELDQREKGNVPNVKKDDIKKVCWARVTGDTYTFQKSSPYLGKENKPIAGETRKVKEFRG